LYSQSVTPCLLSKGIVTPGGCTAIGEPYPDGCFAGVQRNLARSINMESMSTWNTNNFCPLDCQKPYTSCFFGNYCPDKYCDMIKMLVDLNASLIVRAVNLYDTHQELRPGTGIYEGAKQLVIDVNAAYDCRGLRRPIIQAGIFEHINQYVSYVTIPASLINEFKYEEGFDSNLYLDSNGQPKEVKFSHLRIQFDNPNQWTNTVPDLRKIEARMWILYMAKIFIDLGYKSIHLGLMGSQDLTLIYTNEVLTRIRSYAAQKNTFVLLTNENKKSQKRGGYNTFLYDYDSNALRVREISSPQVIGDYNCTNAVNSQLFNGTPFATVANKGFIDYCVLRQNQPTTSGVSPLGCDYPIMPYNTYFDFGRGLISTGGLPSPTPANTAESTWGYSDARWFADEIGEAGRTYWMGYAISTLRSFDNGHGFMIAPGILSSGHEELWGTTQVAGNYYLLSDDLPTLDLIKSKWTPNPDAGIKITRTCTPTKLGLRPTYKLSVDNPDLTTIYTWHIRYPDGTWAPFTYGTQRILSFGFGSMTIQLRKDNLGFSPSTFGTIIATKVVNLPNNCTSSFLRQPNNDSNNSEIELMRKDKEYEKYILDNPILETNKIKIDGAENLNFISEMTLSPNPVIDNFQINYKSFSKGNYKIQGFNSQGSQVFGLDKQLEQDEVMQTEVSTHKWVNGMYIITIKNEYGEIVSTAKLVVSK
jgi:hypothetical protein